MSVTVCDKMISVLTRQLKNNSQLKKHCPTEIAKFRSVYSHVISPNATKLSLS